MGILAFLTNERARTNNQNLLNAYATLEEFSRYVRSTPTLRDNTISQIALPLLLGIGIVYAGYLLAGRLTKAAPLSADELHNKSLETNTKNKRFDEVLKELEANGPGTQDPINIDILEEAAKAGRFDVVEKLFSITNESVQAKSFDFILMKASEKSRFDSIIRIVEKSGLQTKQEIRYFILKNLLESEAINDVNFLAVLKACVKRPSVEQARETA